MRAEGECRARQFGQHRDALPGTAAEWTTGDSAFSRE